VPWKLFAEDEDMGFPDRIDRETTLRRHPEDVWTALTTAEGLGAWLGERAEIDLRPGGVGSITFASGLTVELRVERVEKPTIFAYTWRLPNLPDDDPRRTYVEFTLHPSGDGTLLHVTESGFAQLPLEVRQETYEAHRQGWLRELDELAEHLHGA
jgi:uncharacterized protein YndB with AHSA1/START domain